MKIPVIDDEEFELDEEFYCELYEPSSGFLLSGKDTRCSVLIIDDDKPGTITFENTSVKVLSSEIWATINLKRINGCKGKIICKYKTTDVETNDTKSIAG